MFHVKFVKVAYQNYWVSELCVSAGILNTIKQRIGN
jgi:hypothetical protein